MSTRLAAAFCMGVLCALWLLPVWTGATVQRLRLDRDRALAELAALRTEVLRLKVASARQALPLVKGVSLHVDGPDQRVMLAARERLRKELAAQVGRPVDEVNPILLYSQLQGRLLQFDGLLYQLELKLLIIGAELKLYGSLHPVRNH